MGITPVIISAGIFFMKMGKTPVINTACIILWRFKLSGKSTRMLYKLTAVCKNWVPLKNNYKHNYSESDGLRWLWSK